MSKTVSYADFKGNGYMQIPAIGSDTLHDLTNSSYTFSVICKPEYIEPIPLEEFYEDYALIVRSGLHTGIFYSTVNVFTGKIWEDNKDNEHTIHTGWWDGKIIHLIFSVNYTEKKLNFYTNGETIYEISLPKNVNLYKYPTENSDYYVGCANPYSDDFNHFYNGKIYEVSMWNTELKDTEVSTLYNNKFDMDLTENLKDYKSSENLVGYWNFDWIVDNKIFDESLSDNVGVLSDNVKIKTEKI